MPSELDALGFRVLMGEAVELADPIALAADPRAFEEQVIRACGAAGPHLFAIAQAKVLAVVFSTYPALRGQMQEAFTNLIAAQAAAAAAEG